MEISATLAGAVDLAKLSNIDLSQFAGFTTLDFARYFQQHPEAKEKFHEFFSVSDDDYKTTQLAYYVPMNDMAAPVHRSTAREIAIVGGNRSGKTETALVELIIRATGHVPMALKATYPTQNLRPPIRGRVVCNSLTDTLEPVIKPKLRWDQWNGPEGPESGRGHWGWVPRRCLWGGDWEKAYSEKYRTLRLSVDTHWVGTNGAINRITGISQIQFLSYDQDLSAFSGTSLHVAIHDELPPSDIYRENRMRTLDTKGTIITAFTPPDEAGGQRGDVAWFFDQVYERGLAGPGKDPSIDTFVLFTERNKILSSADLELITRTLTEEQKQARLYGQFQHLSGVVYPLFASYPSTWCFQCSKKSLGQSRECSTCGGTNVEPFCHVIDPFEIPKEWPVIFVIDPHPRKKDAMGWFAISPSDQVIMIGEHEGEGDAGDVAKQILDWERLHQILPAQRLMDPNIATQTNDRLEHGWTLRMAYDRVGIRCDLPSDRMDVGIQNVNALLRPDPGLRQPRFLCFSTNRRFIFGMRHWAWEEWSRQASDKEPKEVVRERHKDFPDLLRYCANVNPSFTMYKRRQHAEHMHMIPHGGY